MTKFVWCTIGTHPRDMATAKAVIVEAEDIEAAKHKVCEDVSAGNDPEEEKELYEGQAETYGSEWFLQVLADGDPL